MATEQSFAALPDHRDNGDAAGPGICGHGVWKPREQALRGLAYAALPSMFLWLIIGAVLMILL